MKKFLAVCLLLLFWLIFPLSFFIFTLQQTLLSGAYYKAQFQKNNTYAGLLEFAGENLASQSDLAQMPEVSAAEVKEIINFTFSPQWLQTQVETIIDSTFGLLEPGAKLNDLAQANIDLTEPKTNLGPAIGREDISQQLLGSLPDQYNLLELVNFKHQPMDQWQVQLDQLQIWLQIVKLATLACFILSGLFLLILALLFVRQPKSLIKWVSQALFIPGLAGLGLFVPVKLIFVNAKYLQPLIMQSAGLPKEFSSLNAFLADILETLIGGFISPLLWASAVCAVLGLILLIIAKFIPSQNLTTKA